MDSRALSRKLAAVGLILGAVLLAVSGLVDPAWADDGDEYLQEVGEATGRYAIAGALLSLAALMMVAGMLGVAKLLRRRRLTLGQVAATMIAVGFMGLTAGLAFNSLDIVLAEAENREAAVAIYDDIEDEAGAIVYFVIVFFICAMLGLLLLAISLFRRRDVVPIWSPIVLLLGIVATFALGESSVGSFVGGLVLAAGLFPLAMRMWSLTDEQWERWAPLDEVPSAVGTAPETATMPPEPAALR
jgi:hypothetical protein